jgi:hypothetical protein
MSEIPRLSSIDLWESHRSRCLELLERALAHLASGQVDESEHDLNRRLYRAIGRAQWEAARAGEGSIPVPAYEARNAPIGSDTEFDPREHKIPDFQWAYIDHLAPIPEAAIRFFTVECKRLRIATSSWDFFAQYVEQGVLRFLTPAHSYGKDTPAGAMVGYLQRISAEDAQKEVDAVLGAKDLPVLALRRDAEPGPSERDHVLTRPFSNSPFLLTHLWIRSC